MATRSRYWHVLWMILGSTLLTGSALAADYTVVIRDDALYRGVRGLVLVAATVDGVAGPSTPHVEFDGVPAQRSQSIAPGVWGFPVTPGEKAVQIGVTVGTGADVYRTDLPVASLPASRLTLPSRITGDTTDGRVRFVVRGPDLPEPESLSVVLGEGVVESITTVDQGLAVTVAIERGYSARFVVVGVRDLRRLESPRWGGIRLKRQSTFEISSEPGVSVAVEVSGRLHGPFLAGDDGVVSVSIDQYPEDTYALVTARDSLGNTTMEREPFSLLGEQQRALVADVAGHRVLGRAEPLVFLRAVYGDGAAWVGNTPVCRAPGADELSVAKLDVGSWVLALPELTADQVGDLRIRCELQRAVGRSLVVPLAVNVPATMKVRVFPEELSTDFPVADVRVRLENASGDSVETEGVTLTARHGEVTTLATSHLSVEGEYNGVDAIEWQLDVIEARYDAPSVGGECAFVDFGWDDLPLPTGLDAPVRAIVHVRAMNPSQRPLAGYGLDIMVGEESVPVVTGNDGWASAEWTLESIAGAVPFSARCGQRVQRGVLIGGNAATGGPGTPDLIASHELLVAKGRIMELRVKPLPPVLHAIPKAMGHVVVDLLDRNGDRADGPRPELTASEGRLEPITTSDLGVYVWGYEPPGGIKVRDITLTAESTLTGATGSATMVVKPAPVNRALGVAIGGITNFGAIGSPFVSLDHDVRVRLGPISVMFRSGVAWYQDYSVVDTGIGDPADLRLMLLPITLGGLVRYDLGIFGFWFGLGVIAAPYRGEVRFGSELADVSWGMLPPGGSLIGGWGIRVPAGELVVELRGSTLFSAGETLSYRGPLGGLAGLVGYRLVY